MRILLILFSLLALPAFASSYTKIANNGSILPDSAVLGTASGDWACTRDDSTGLIWEVKAADGGLRDLRKSYTYYDDPSKPQKWNSDHSELINPTQADIVATTNSIGFVKAVNVASLCGSTGWRMPITDELKGLAPKINSTYFPNTPNSGFWSGSPDNNGSFYAWYVLFTSGFVVSAHRYDRVPVRLVNDGFAIDTSNTSLSGLWWNQEESGWGMAITHEYGMIFATMYTYDVNKKPVWFIASSCPVTANRCTGTLYAVQGGTALTTSWNGSNLAVTPAGTLNLEFSDNNTGTMTYTINGVDWSKHITRNIFAKGSTLPATDYSGLWWNPDESGWGIALTRQADMSFATIYTYDANGNPVWYIASSCPIVGSGCSGSLYSVSGGTQLATPWNASALSVTSVGTLNLSFTDLNSGAMSFTVKGVSSSRAIQRNVFANPAVAPQH
jgi:hypothetical protein